MEKTINNHEPTINEFLSLENRKKLHISNIEEVISSSDNHLEIKLKDTRLSIGGTNINITKLDTETKILEADGNFSKIIYGKETNVFKRIFKWNYHIYYN